MKDKRYANRGKKLEKLIDEANDHYRNLGLADIRKVPTPFKPLKLKGNLVTGHFMKPDWVDYVGVYRGNAVCIEAKQTAGKSLPLANIHDQQFDFMESWYKNGAQVFLLVYFSESEDFYLLPYFNLKEAKQRMVEGGRKSIAIDEFELWAYKVTPGAGVKLNYLDFLGI